MASAPEFQGAVKNALLSDWRLAVIYRWISGAPLTIQAGSDRALTGLGAQAAEQVSDDVYQDTSGELGSQYFNRAAFALPALGTYGNSGFFAFDGFPDWGLDAALSRIFQLPGTPSPGSAGRGVQSHQRGEARRVRPAPAGRVHQYERGDLRPRDGGAGPAHPAVRSEVRVLAVQSR